MDQLRILITGSRKWTDVPAIERALLAAVDTAVAMGSDWTRQASDVIIVHGASVDRDGNPVGADWLADGLAGKWGFTPERHPAKDHPSPKARNLFMVRLGAYRCLACALKWASGTGHCARAARRAGIHTIDCGVDTA